MSKDKKEVRVFCNGMEHIFESKQEAFDCFVDKFRKCNPESEEANQYLYILNKILGNEEKKEDKNGNGKG